MQIVAEGNSRIVSMFASTHGGEFLLNGFNYFHSPGSKNYIIFSIHQILYLINKA